jgi:hypothetical protein
MGSLEVVIILKLLLWLALWFWSGVAVGFVAVFLVGRNK